MFRLGDSNAVVTGLALEGGYVEFWPKVRRVVAKHSLKICILLAIYTFSMTAGRNIGFLKDGKLFYKCILFTCVIAFLYAYQRCQRIVSSGLIFHLYSVLTNNLSLIADIDALGVLFDQLDDAIRLGSAENFIYQPELHPKLHTSDKNKPDPNVSRISFRIKLKNASLKVISLFCLMLKSRPIALLIFTLVSYREVCLVTAKNFLYRGKRTVSKTWKKVSSVGRRVWKRISSTSRKSLQKTTKPTKPQ